MTDDNSTRASKALSAVLLRCVKEYQDRRPPVPLTTIEILDALAFSSACILRGTGVKEYPNARDRFFNCVVESVEELGGPMWDFADTIDFNKLMNGK
jgi:hypothetical protein